MAGGVLGAAGGLTAVSSRVSGATEPGDLTYYRVADTGDGCDPSAGDGGDRSTLLADEPVVGANLNGRPRLLDGNYHLIDESGTTWVRAFFDVRKKDASDVRPENDPDVLALRRAARQEGCKLIVSLKWDFKASWGDKEPIRVPEAETEYESELCECAARYLGAIGEPIDVVVLGNEPMWETRADDITVDDPPVVEFTRTVKDHLVENGDHGDPTYLVGSFNRTHSTFTKTIQFPEFHRAMFDMVRTDDDIDGVDLHVHYDELAQAEKALSTAREEVPDGIITVTEFSPVWRYDRHTETPIGEFEAGEAFALDYGFSPEMTVVEYLQHAKKDPRPPEELADFYASMPWFNAEHIGDIYALFDRYDVSIGTIGFLQGLGMRNTDWTTGWTPFHINFLFQPALMRTDGGIENTAQAHYIEDYRAVSSVDGTRAASPDDRRRSPRSDRGLASYFHRATRRYWNCIFRPSS